MKVHELAPDSDLLCQDSLNLLSQKIRAFFNHEFPGSELWFPDDTAQWQNSKSNATQVHIILYGNLLRALAEIPFWPGKSVYLWVLSESSKSSVVEILNINPNQVSVIPRSIFRSADSIQKSLSNELIYAGRISRQKNILDLIFTLFFLQHDHSSKYKLKLFGAFDDEYNQDIGRMHFEQTFENELTSLVSKLNWKTNPKFEGKKDPHEWPKLLSENNTLISLSHFLMEDFGVSIAQAHEKGISTITSDWGGYKDIQSKNHFSITSLLLGSELTPIGLRISNTRKIAKMISNFKTSESPIQIPLKSEIPLPLSRQDLTNAHSLFIKKAGPKAVYLSRDQLAPFADTQEGKSLIHSVVNNFETNFQKTIVLIVSQMGTTHRIENQQIYCAFQEDDFENSKIMILDGSQVTQKWALAVLMQANQLLITSETLKKYPNLNEHLKNLHPQMIVLKQTVELPFNLDKILTIE